MPVVSASRLEEFVTDIARAGGSSGKEAGQIARQLLGANLRGHDSHGVGMMPAYVNALQFGKLSANQHVSVVQENGSMLLLDGNAGYGQVIGEEAMEKAITVAKADGMCLMSLRNSHHLGRIGAWGEQATDAGLISIHWVNGITRIPSTAPFGGSDARFITNPYCTAIPATPDHPRMVLDMATTKVAMGKLRVAYNKGVEVPPGCVIDSEGNPTLDPSVMYEEPRGAMLPMGDHKGYGLALVCEILAGALSGGGTFLPDRSDGFSIINNMLTILVDPDRLCDRTALMTEVDAFIKHVKQSPPAPGVDEVMIPGDPERKAMADRLANGVPVDDATWEEMVQAAIQVGMDEAAARAYAA